MIGWLSLMRSRRSRTRSEQEHWISSTPTGEGVVRLFAVESLFGFEVATKLTVSYWNLPPAGGDPQATVWEPPPIKIYTVEGAAGGRLLESDFPTVLRDDFWLSERAARCLAPLLDQYGELLP